MPVGRSNWSPGRSYFVQDSRHGFAIRAADLGTEVGLGVPQTGAVISLPVWESPAAVLVLFDPTGDRDNPDYDTDAVPISRTYVLRCSAATGACEVAQPPGFADDLAGPLYF